MANLCLLEAFKKVIASLRKLQDKFKKYNFNKSKNGEERTIILPKKLESKE
jgi:hypothetical protein